MQDFNSIYSDYHSAFQQGHQDGAKEALSKTQEDIAHSAEALAKQHSKQQDTQKCVKKLHSSIVEQKLSYLKDKIQHLTKDYFQSDKSLQELGLSVEYLQYEKKDLKSKFQTILVILGIKQYEKRALEFSGQNPAISTNLQSVAEKDDDDLDF